MQLKLNYSKSKLERPINKNDLKDYIENFVSNNTTNFGQKIVKEPIINQLTTKEAVKIANNEEYSIELVEKELKGTIRSLIGLGMVLSFPIFAK